MAGKPRIEIDYNTIYQSNSCGPFKIIENMGRDERSRLFVKVKFLETGTEKITRYDIAIDGKITDDLFGIDFNKIYYSIYYGPYKIIKYIGRNKESKRIVRIKFINSGYEYDVLFRLALEGKVKDQTIKHSDMYIDSNIDQIKYDDYIIEILKGRWKSMMSRCYNEKAPHYSEYGALGVKVCNRWHNLENYLSDIYLVDNFIKFYQNPTKYQLDKDYKQLSIPKCYRIYDVSRCIFISIYDNANLAIMEKHDPKEFYGIKRIGNNFQVVFSIDGSKFNFGIYSNIIAAANAYNYYYLMYSKAECIQLLNNVEYMPFEETQKYLTNRQS